MKQNVDFSRGFRRFFTYLLLSAALGFFAKSVVHKVLLDQWAEFSPEAQKHGVMVSPPELLLSRSGLPVIGARIPLITTQKQIQQKSRCFDVDVQVKDVFLPLSWTKLLVQKAEVETLKVSHLQILLNEVRECYPQKLITEESSDERLENPSQEMTPQKMAEEIPKWFKTADQWFEREDELTAKIPFKNVDIQNIQIKVQYLKDKVFTADGEAYLSTRKAVEGELRFYNMELKKGNKRIASNLRADLSSKDKKASIKANLGFDEGHLTVDFTIDQQGTVDLQLASQQFPVSVLNRWLETSWSFQYLWLNCELGIHAAKKDWNSTEWKVSKCMIDGPNGSVKVINETINSIEKPANLKVVVEKLNMNNAIKGAQDLPLTGIFKGLGVWNATIDFKDSKWAAKFSVADAEVIFSRNNRRKLQVIESIQGDAGYVDGVYQYFVRSVKIKDGNFKGLLAFEYNKKLRRRHGSAFIEKLTLSPEIQLLMFNGQISSLNMSSEFSAGVNGLDVLTASIRIEQYISNGVEAKQGVLVAELLDDRHLQFKAQIESAKISASGHSFEWLPASLLGEFREPLMIKHVRGNVTFDIEERMAQWNNVSGFYGNWSFSTAGTYNSDKVWDGQWLWSAGTRKLSWRFETVDENDRWIPLEPPMEAWIEANSEYKKAYPFVVLAPKNP